MFSGLPVALALLAEAPAPAEAPPPIATASTAEVYGPPAPPPPTKKAKVLVQDSCAAAQASADRREIIICAQRSDGYRLNPDVMEARRETRNALAGRAKTPMEKMRVDSCAIGPAGCTSAGINLLAAAMTAVTMAKRLAQGKEIGSMFVTDPQPDEYHLYLAAKHRREAKEAEARAEAIAKAAQAAAGRTSPKPAESADDVH